MKINAAYLKLIYNSHLSKTTKMIHMNLQSNNLFYIISILFLLIMKYYGLFYKTKYLSYCEFKT